MGRVRITHTQQGSSQNGRTMSPATIMLTDTTLAVALCLRAVCLCYRNLKDNCIPRKKVASPKAMIEAFLPLIKLHATSQIPIPQHTRRPAGRLTVGSILLSELYHAGRSQAVFLDHLEPLQDFLHRQRVRQLHLRDRRLHAEWVSPPTQLPPRECSVGCDGACLYSSPPTFWLSGMWL